MLSGLLCYGVKDLGSVIIGIGLIEDDGEELWDRVDEDKMLGDVWFVVGDYIFCVVLLFLDDGLIVVILLVCLEFNWFMYDGCGLYRINLMEFWGYFVGYFDDGRGVCGGYRGGGIGFGGFLLGEWWRGE